MGCPEAALLDRYILDGQMSAVLHQNQRDTGIESAVNLVFTDLTVVDFLGTINDTATADAYAVCIFGVDKVLTWFTVVIAIYKSGDFYHVVVSIFRQITNIIIIL